MNIKPLSALAITMLCQPALASIPDSYVGNNTLVFYGAIGTASGTAQVHRNDTFSLSFTQTVINENLVNGVAMPSYYAPGNSLQTPSSVATGGISGGFSETVTFTDLTTGFTDSFTTLNPFTHQLNLRAGRGIVSADAANASPDGDASAAFGNAIKTPNFDSQQFYVSLKDSAEISVSTTIPFYYDLIEGSGVSYSAHGLSFRTAGTAIIYKVEVNPVPLPSSLWLFGSGLAGLFAARQRHRSSI
jgi:hypothetical protein